MIRSFFCRRYCRPDECFPDKVLPLVAQDLAPVSNYLIILSLFLEGVLDFKEIAEVSAKIYTQVNFLLFCAVVENNQVFHEAVADKTATDNGKRGVLIDRSRRRNTEMLSIVILDGVRGQHIECECVDTECPLRQMAHIFKEKTLLLIWFGVDITVGARDEKC